MQFKFITFDKELSILAQKNTFCIMSSVDKNINLASFLIKEKQNSLDIVEQKTINANIHFRAMTAFLLSD